MIRFERNIAALFFYIDHFALDVEGILLSAVYICPGIPTILSYWFEHHSIDSQMKYSKSEPYWLLLLQLCCIRDQSLEF
jgi:hypothetical protein